MPPQPEATSNTNNSNRIEKKHIIKIRQQPKHSRMCGFGEKVDRRPVDPPPIIQLFVENADSSEDVSYMFNPHYFLYASLIGADNDEEIHLLRDGKTRSTAGSIVSSLFRLKDTNQKDGVFFVFPDLSVRMEGCYRLKFSLFEIVDAEIYFCTSVVSEPFNVFTAKKFPGMGESTALSKTFAEQGLKIRIRKEVRTRVKGPKRSYRGDSGDDDDSSVRSEDVPPSPREVSSNSSDKEKEPEPKKAKVIAESREEVLHARPPLDPARLDRPRPPFGRPKEDYPYYPPYYSYPPPPPAHGYGYDKPPFEARKDTLPPLHGRPVEYSYGHGPHGLERATEVRRDDESRSSKDREPFAAKYGYDRRERPEVRKEVEYNPPTRTETNVPSEDRPGYYPPYEGRKESEYGRPLNHIRDPHMRPYPPHYGYHPPPIYHPPMYRYPAYPGYPPPPHVDPHHPVYPSYPLPKPGDGDHGRSAPHYPYSESSSGYVPPSNPVDAPRENPAYPAYAPPPTSGEGRDASAYPPYGQKNAEARDVPPYPFTPKPGEYSYPPRDPYYQYPPATDPYYRTPYARPPPVDRTTLAPFKDTRRPSQSD